MEGEGGEEEKRGGGGEGEMEGQGEKEVVGNECRAWKRVVTEYYITQYLDPWNYKSLEAYNILCPSLAYCSHLRQKDD